MQLEAREAANCSQASLRKINMHIPQLSAGTQQNRAVSSTALQ